MNLKEKFMKKIKKYNTVVMVKTFFPKALKLSSPNSSQNPKVLIKKLSILMIAEIKIEKIIMISNKDESNIN